MPVETQREEIVLAARYPDGDMAALASLYTLHILPDSADPAALLREIAPRIRVLATNGEVGADKALMDALPHLEAIVSYGVGVDPIDLGHAASRGIRVTHTPDVLTDDVADMGIGLLLAVARDIPANDALVRAGQWDKVQIPLTTRIFRKRLGILGLGRVGQAVAKRAAAFEMSVSYHDRHHFADLPYAYREDPVALARDCDILMLCAAADTANRGLVGAAVFEALGPEGIVVNIARGSIVDEPALIDALANKRIRGAALDVFWNEPAIDPAFFSLGNVVLQPHRSSATRETRAAMGQLVRDNLAAFLAGQPLPTPVPGH